MKPLFDSIHYSQAIALGKDFAGVCRGRPAHLALAPLSVYRPYMSACAALQPLKEVLNTERFADPEEQVRAEFWAELIYRYDYPQMTGTNA